MVVRATRVSKERTDDDPWQGLHTRVDVGGWYIMESDKRVGEDRRQVDMDSLDARLRRVEEKLAEQVIELRLWREMDTRDDSRRRDTCPHNEDFVKILASLEAGGKRFDEIERCVTAYDGRIDRIEKLLLKKTSFFDGAKWMLVLIGGAIVWTIDRLWITLAK
jgi:hypothetical protein